MALTEEDKKRIKEEEEYRKKVREEEEYRRQLHQDTQPTRHKKKTKRNWKKIIIFAVVIFAVLVVLGAVVGEPETEPTESYQQATTTITPTSTVVRYPAEVRSAYLRSCTDGNDLKINYCGCTLEYYEENFTLEEFTSLSTTNQSNQSYTQNQLDAYNACRKYVY